MAQPMQYSIASEDKMKNTIDLIRIYPRSSESSLDIQVEINGKKYDFAIRFLKDANNEEKLTILKDAELWHVETSTFGYPSD